MIECDRAIAAGNDRRIDGIVIGVKMATSGRKDTIKNTYGEMFSFG